MKKIFIVTGELSAFNYAKALIPYLKDEFKIYGAFLDDIPGAERVIDSKELIAFGLFESLLKLPSLIKAKGEIADFLKKEKVDAVLLVDFPGFNLKIAEIAKNIGIKVLYFISPKFWAWGEGRVKKVKKNVDRMFVIFPFEVDFYRKWGMNVTYVGNPLVDIVKPSKEKEAFYREFSIKPPLYALLPGSRQTEINYLLKPMLEAVKNLKGTFAIPVASSVNRKQIEETVKKIKPDVLLLPESERYNLLFHSEAGIIASGTASLEAAIAGLPHVVLYKLNPLTYLIAKRVVKVPFVSLPNIIAGEKIVPELLQSDARKDKIQKSFANVIENRETMLKTLKERVTSQLRGNALKTLADEIKRELQ
ncbi:lipid-A-disaccharide synthase [Desulfurobacterium pacificum]|uniref:Lipid-A-disaccharide synthase n=1 Tax=Desulfurobacterium pacificum TaxID=240166 RepID=A0ABY1NQV8_9BACT|nr:lipid-A-disaccharide synthase [Desulfurobacterium pacificum]SMP15852.1 lipid-A-disaccharide synthase [Desulfurobacterium pacificum]